MPYKSFETARRPHIASYDSGYEHSVERLLEVRRLIALADWENVTEMPSHDHEKDQVPPRRWAQA